MGKVSKLPPDDIFIQKSSNQRQIARKYNCSPGCVSVHARRLNLGGLVYAKNETIRNLVQANTPIKVMRELLNLKAESLRKRMNQLGFLRYGLRSNERVYQIATLKHKFSNDTKRQRFLEENGTCQWCKRLIGSGLDWHEAKGVSYHHWIPLKYGGGADAWNCMVLHRSCHYDPEIFKILHNFKNVYSDPLFYKKCNWCGTPAHGLTLGICSKCRRVPDEAILRDFQEGATTTQIATKNNMASCSVNVRLRKLKVSIIERDTKLGRNCLLKYNTHDFIDAINYGQSLGRSLYEIAKELSVAPQTVKGYLCRS